MWIVTAWQCISPDVMVKGFKKCCISSAVDVNDDDMLWERVDRIGMLGMCEGDEGTTVKVETVTIKDS